MSFAYERGWRQGFSWAGEGGAGLKAGQECVVHPPTSWCFPCNPPWLSGFPGVDKEFDMAMDYLHPAYGSVLVDMSCGSGLFSRRCGHKCRKREGGVWE